MAQCPSPPGREALLTAALVHPSEPRATSEWWRGAMLYEIYIRSFLDTTGSGVGDLRGVIDRLDYLRDLGVDGFWLTPFYPSPQKDFGYDVSDYRGVDPQFGTLDDIRRLIDGAHARGLRMLIDFVPCHTSDEHPWFLESRKSRDNAKADWYIWTDRGPDGAPPNNWLSSFGGPAWRWEPRRAQYVYHPFLACQPALNLSNPEVLDALEANMRFWLDMGIDGLRVDAVQYLRCDPYFRSNPPTATCEGNSTVGGGPNNPFKFQIHMFDRDVPEAIPVLERMRRIADAYGVERVLVGELGDMDSARFSVKYTMEGRRLHAIYDFDLINGAHSVSRWLDVLRLRALYMGSGWTMNVLTNHDSIRAISNLLPDAVAAGHGADAAKALLFLQATLQGGGIIFQGDELGLPQPRLAYADIRDPWAKAFWPEFEGRDGVRVPLPWRRDARHGGFTTAAKPWLPVPEEHLPLAVDVQLADAESVLNFARRMLRWRRGEPLTRTGREALHDDIPPNVIAFDRYSQTDRLSIAVNLGMGACRMAVEGQPVFEPITSKGVEWKDGAIHMNGLTFAAYRVESPSSQRA